VLTRTSLSVAAGLVVVAPVLGSWPAAELADVLAVFGESAVWVNARSCGHFVIRFCSVRLDKPRYFYYTLNRVKSIKEILL
jgi:hypothetical protein